MSPQRLKITKDEKLLPVVQGCCNKCCCRNWTFEFQAFTPATLLPLLMPHRHFKKLAYRLALASKLPLLALPVPVRQVCSKCCHVRSVQRLAIFL